MKKLGIIVLFSTFLLPSCNHSMKRALAEIQNMPTADYSYVVQPEYSFDRESLEFNLKELYSAEEVKIGAAGIHNYDKKTNKQKDEKFWLKVVLLNSKSIVDFKDEQKMNSLGKAVAESALEEITNSEKYDKIQVTFIEKWNDVQQKQVKQNIFYKLPDLSLTDL